MRGSTPASRPGARRLMSRAGIPARSSFTWERSCDVRSSVEPRRRKCTCSTPHRTSWRRPTIPLPYAARAKCMPLEPAMSVRSRSKNAAPRCMRSEASCPGWRPWLAVPRAQAGAQRDELRLATLARLCVEDRLVRGIAAEERLVGDDQPRAPEHHARWRVIGDRRAVRAGSWNRRESLEVVSPGTDHGDLVAARERDVDPARACDPEAVGAVEGGALPQTMELARAVVAADANGVELAGRRVSVSTSGRALLHDEQGAVVRLQDDAGGAELVPVEPAVGEPDLGFTAARRHAPNDGLEVIGDVQGTAGPPCRVVGNRRVVAPGRGAVWAAGARRAWREVGEPGVGAEPLSL